MTITKQTVAGKITAYLHHEITIAQLADWAEKAMMVGKLDKRALWEPSSIYEFDTRKKAL